MSRSSTFFKQEDFVFNLDIFIPATFGIVTDVSFPVKKIVAEWSYAVSSQTLNGVYLTSNLFDGNIFAVISKKPDFEEGPDPSYNTNKGKSQCSFEYLFGDYRYCKGSYNVTIHPFNSTQGYTGTGLLTLKFYG